MNNFSNKFITIYDFDDAPDELQNLSTNGGDEDWIAIIPIKLYEKHYGIHFLESTSFSCCGEPEIINLYDEFKNISHKVYIGSHA